METRVLGEVAINYLFDSTPSDSRCEPRYVSQV